MGIEKVLVDGIEYPLAPLEPEEWDHPSPAHLLAITPEVARRWLNFNYRNRNQREQGKRDYSADMRDRNFEINGATITFTRPHREGEDELVPAGKVAILDGQHRLESCAASGTPFVTYVAFGLQPRVRTTIDTGIKRKFSDVLALRGEQHSNDLSAVTLRVHHWLVGNFHLNAKRGGNTHSRLLETLEKHPDIRRSVEVAMQTHHDFSLSTGNSLRKSVTGLAHWLFMQTDATAAPEFFARLGDGAKMETSDPIMALRRRIVKDQTVKRQVEGDTRRRIPVIEDWQYLVYYIRTWNARFVWQSLPESEQHGFSFALVSRNDGERMPTIRNAEEALSEYLRRINKNPAA